jgi:hypothetical protein
VGDDRIGFGPVFVGREMSSTTAASAARRLTAAMPLRQDSLDFVGLAGDHDTPVAGDQHEMRLTATSCLDDELAGPGHADLPCSAADSIGFQPISGGSPPTATQQPSLNHRGRSSVIDGSGDDLDGRRVVREDEPVGGGNVAIRSPRPR